MNKGKQATLFQTWDHCLRKNNDKSEINTAFINSECYKTISLLDDDEDDEELSLALEHSLANHIETSESSDTTNNFGVVSFGYVEKYHSAATDASDFLSQWKPSDGPHGDVFGFDRSAGQLWVYPINFPLRDYQLSIVRQALLKNTLVILPTGLGKTFIAAVVMYNFYRWYPEGKIIFMAPTKPLVAQQIDACYNMMGIPEADTMEMTGSINPIERRSAWLQRRVFFLTPQVIANDLIRGSFQAQTIKCLVFDEAHKAMGNYAYCQVVREVLKCTKNFRVLALSATPGNDLKCVQQILNNLCISHIELRSEDSPDIKPYIHERVVEKIVLPLGDDLCQLKAKYCRILSKVVKRLVRQHVLYHRDPSSLSKFLILNARESFRQRPPASLPRNQYSSVECDFGMALTLYHGYELLQLHGAKSFFNFLHGVINGDKMNGRTRAEVLRNDDFKEIMSMLQEQFQFGTSCLPSTMSAILSGHPKFEKLEEVILKHFKHQMTGLDSRAMVFTQYRDTVDEITNLLHGHQPLIKVKSFVGHSSSGRSSKGFTHKDQLEAMQEFRSGKYNVLVSTCVGEEGLDIGHVDLIVCFDAHNSPVRLIQRMGRTGRSRRGRVVMLMMEGKEEQMYKQSQYSRSCVHNAIIYKGAKSLMYYRDNPRMVPADITPVCHRIHIAVPEKRQQKRTCVRRTKREGVKGIGKRARSSSITSDKDEDVTSDSQVISYDQYCQLRSSGYRHHQRTLPTPIMHCLQPHENKVDCGGMGSSAVQLDLSEWLPWQNMLQQTSLFGHGKRSVNLVDLLEFTDLQQMRTSHEDSYGREMALHLNMADVSVTAQPCSDRLQCPPCLTPCCSNTSTAGNAIALVESENVHLGNVPGTSRCRVSGTEDIRHVDLPTDIIIPNNNNIDSAVEMSHDHQQRAEGCSCKVIDGRMHDGDHFSPGISICNECCSAPVITADYLVNSSLYHQPNGSPPVSRKALRSLLLDVRRDDWLNVRSCHVIKRNAQRRFVPPLSFLSPPSSDHLEVLSKFVNCMNSSNSKVTDLLQLSTEQSSHRCPKDVENMFTLSDVQVSCGPRLQTHVAGEMSNLSRASPGNSLVECTHDSSAMDLFLSDFSPAAGDIYKYDKCPAIDQSLDKQVNHFSEPHDRFGHAASTCQDKYLSSKSSQQAGTCQDKNLSSKSYQPAGTCQGKNQFSRTSQPAGTCQYKNLSSKSALPAGTCQDKNLSSKSYQPASTCQDKDLSSKSSTSTIVPLCGNALTVHHFGEMGSKYNPLSAYDSDTVTAHTCMTTCGSNTVTGHTYMTTCGSHTVTGHTYMTTCGSDTVTGHTYMTTCGSDTVTGHTYMTTCGSHTVTGHTYMTTCGSDTVTGHTYMTTCGSHTVTGHTYMTTCGSHTVTGHTYMTTCGSHTVTGHTYMTTCFSNTVIGRCHISTCGSNCDISHTSMTTCSSNTLIGYSPITTVCSNTVTGHSSITTRDSYTLNRHSQITARVSDDVLCSPVSTCVSDTVVLCRPVSTCVSDTVVLCKPMSTCVSDTVVLCSPMSTCVGDTVVLCRPVSTCVSDTAVLCSPVFTCVSDTVVLCTPVSTCASDNVVLCSPVSTCSVDTLVGHSLMTTRYPYIVHQTSLIATCVNCTPIIHGSMNTCCPVATTSRQSFIAVSCTPIIHGSMNTCCPVATTSRQSFIAVSCTPIIHGSMNTCCPVATTSRQSFIAVSCTPIIHGSMNTCCPVATTSRQSFIAVSCTPIIHGSMNTCCPVATTSRQSFIAVSCTPIIHGSMNTCCPVATTSRQSFIAVSCTPIIHGSTDTCCPVATTSRQSFIAVSCTSNIFKDHVYRSSPNFNLGFDFDEDIIPPSPLIAACQTHYMGHSCSSPSTSVGNSKADVEMSAVVCECAVQSLLFPDAMAIMKDEELIEQDHLQTYMRGVTRETRRTAVGGLGGKSVCVDQQGQEVPHNGLPSMKRSSSSMCCQMLSVNPGSFDAVITGRSMCSLTSCTFYNNSSIGNGDRFVKSSGIPQLTLSSIGNNDCFADVPSFNLNPDFQDDDNDNFFPSNDFLSDNIEDTYVLNQTSVSSNSLTPLCVPDHCGSNSANPLQGQQSHHGLSLLCDTVSHVAVITSCDICVSTMQEDNIGMLSGDCHSSRARSDDVIMSVHHNSDVCTVNTMPSPISSCLGGQSHWSVGIKGSLIGVSDDFKANEHDDFLDRYVLKKKLRKNQVVASKKTHNYNFLDDEAQQSNDVLVSSDETDDDSMVLDDYNFVNNAEVSLAAHADMQAVYMKSVKSPVDVPGREGQGRYRLQFNLADVTDVISQSSDNDRSHDESHYMIDSFCVSTDHDSGRDESVKEGDDDHSDEVGDDDHSAEEDDKDNITAASARKGKQRQSKSTLMTGRMRIMRCSGSSSNDSMDGLPPTQICQSNGNGWVTFASSSDESFAL